MSRKEALHHIKHSFVYGEYELPTLDRERILEALEQESTNKKCNTCKYREIDGKRHEMCKSCICGDRYEQEPTTKNNLGVDCISRKAVTLNEPCKDCSEKPWCGGFVCKEAREYLENKSKADRSVEDE